VAEEGATATGRAAILALSTATDEGFSGGRPRCWMGVQPANAPANSETKAIFVVGCIVTRGG
jgi:hypothetical protein